MNKMKKLLSVILAVVLAFSALSVIGSAAKAKYQTVADLEGIDAYSPYGTVTRLSTEERMSIVFDFLDSVLPTLNINMGTVIDTMGITITIDLTSVDRMLDSFDTFYQSLEKNTLVSIAMGIVNLGILEEVSFSTWATGMSRDGTAQLDIVREIVELLANNTGAVDTVLSDGIELGLISSFIKGLDLSGINKIVTDLPSLVKGLVFPLFERWDHTTEEINLIEDALSGNGKIVSNLKWIVEDMLTREQSITTVKADASGNIISEHSLPSTGTRQIYAKSGNTITVSHYYTQSDVDKNETDDIEEVGYAVTGTYVLAPEYPGVADTDYVFQYTDEWGNVQNLKYYETGSYWLPDFVADGNSLDITTETGANLLYKMIPYVFEEMAPTVVNGSLKKLLAGFFGVQWTNLGDITDPEVLAKVKALPGYNASLEVFGEQGDYLWEWSAFDMIEVDGVAHYYYRFQDDIYVGDASKANEYMNIINWDFKLTGDFINKYIPANTGAKSAAGYSKILHAVNQFLVDLATMVVNLDVVGATLTSGDNTKLVGNIKSLAQAILSYHPEHIFGDACEDEDHYYNLIMSSDNDQILTGIAALAVDALAKQMILPGAKALEAQNVKVGGILVAMLRELATQLLPHYDYDELIYADYNSKTFLSGKDNAYWLDVAMTIGVDIGMKYLHNLADLNEDTSAWANLGYTDSMTASKKYTASSFDQTGWEDKVDYIIDWALTSTNDGSILTWSMQNLVGNYVTEAGNTISLGTNEDPWAKLDAVLDGILFLDQFTSETDLETGLRGTITDLLNLNWAAILGTESDPAIIDVPSSSRLVSTNLLNALTLEIKDLVNGLFAQVGGGSYKLIPDVMTDLDTLANQDNLSTLVQGLLKALPTALNNGLLVTALPFVNMFLGWSTDAQKYADPSIYFGSEYVYADATATSANTTINVINNSSGMLLKHRANIKSDGTFVSTVDQPYTLKITKVESSVAGTTYDKDTLEVAPLGTGSITATVPYSGTDTVVRFVITYSFMGKDGKAVGGDMQMVTYQLFTSTKFDNVNGRRDGDDDTDYVGIDQYQIYQFTTDIYTAVTSHTVTANYISGSSAPARIRFGSAVPEGWSSQPTDGKCVTGQAATYFRQIYSPSGYPDEIKNAGWDQYFGGSENAGGKASTSGKLYLALDGVTADTEFPYGLYDMGEIGVKFMKQKNCNGYSDNGGDTKVWEFDFYYYTDFGVDAVMNEYVGKALLASDFGTDAQDEYAAYEASLMNVVKLAQYPVTLNYHTTIQTQIEAAVEDLEAKYEALMLADQSADASADASDVKALEDALANDTTVNGQEINYQDFDLFEYFEYQDYRTAARNLLKGMNAPAVLDKYYVAGSGVSYKELSTSIIPAATATVGAAITASLSERSDEEVAASQLAHDNFVAPVYSELYIDDQAARLDYYRGFILPVAADLTFINREIGYADANYPTSAESLYTATSWAAYREAYADAKAVTSSSLPSDVFAAKYNLMVAMKNLLLVTESAIEQGATADLIANAEIADEILAMALADITLTDDAIAAGYTVEKALGELIVARGYYYVGEDGNTWQLYADSADEYIDNDRPNVSTNIARIDTCNENLADAVALFDVGPSEPNTLMVKDDFDFASDVIIDKEVISVYLDWYGEDYVSADEQAATGLVYGVEAMDYMLADALTTAYGDDYLAVTQLESADGYDATGSIIEVLDEDGNVVETYYFIYFGDLNCDGIIDSMDIADLATIASTGDPMDTLVQYIATDVNGDTVTDSLDISDLVPVVAEGELLPQGEIAAAFYEEYHAQL